MASKITVMSGNKTTDTSKDGRGRRDAPLPSFTGNSERVVEPSSAIYSLLAARYGGAL